MATTDFRTVSITAQNTFSAPIELSSGAVITLEGTWSATVSLQRMTEGTGNWVDVTNNEGTASTFTANGTYTVDPIRVAALYRVGVKTGNFTSGTVVATLAGQ